MKKIIVVVVLAIFLMTIPVSATELEIYPETVEIDLVGGDFVQVNITVSWSGSYPANCELTTYIEPDGEGINITYSRNNFTMEPSSDNNIMMFINASLALMPGTYIITTDVNVEMEKPPKEEDKGDGQHWYPDDYLPGYIPLEPEDEAPDDEEEDEFDDVLYTTTTAKDGRFPFWLFVIGLFIIMIFITLLYLISKKKKKAEKLGDKKK